MKKTGSKKQNESKEVKSSNAGIITLILSFVIGVIIIIGSIYSQGKISLDIEDVDPSQGNIFNGGEEAHPVDNVENISIEDFKDIDMADAALLNNVVDVINEAHNKEDEEEYIPIIDSSYKEVQNIYESNAANELTLTRFQFAELIYKLELDKGIRENIPTVALSYTDMEQIPSHYIMPVTFTTSIGMWKQADKFNGYAKLSNEDLVYAMEAYNKYLAGELDVIPNEEDTVEDDGFSWVDDDYTPDDSEVNEILNNRETVDRLFGHSAAVYTNPKNNTQININLNSLERIELTPDLPVNNLIEWINLEEGIIDFDGINNVEFIPAEEFKCLGVVQDIKFEVQRVEQTYCLFNDTLFNTDTRLGCSLGGDVFLFYKNNIIGLTHVVNDATILGRPFIMLPINHPIDSIGFIVSRSQFDGSENLSDKAILKVYLD